MSRHVVFEDLKVHIVIISDQWYVQKLLAFFLVRNWRQSCTSNKKQVKTCLKRMLRANYIDECKQNNDLHMPAHKMTESFFFQSQPHVRRKVLEFFRSLSVTNINFQSPSNHRGSMRFPASKLHAVGLWVNGKSGWSGTVLQPRKEVSPTPTPGRWDQLTGWQTAPPHPAKDLPFDKNMLEVVLDKPVLFDTKKTNTELTRVFPMKPSIEMFFSGRGSTICCHVLFKTIHAVMSQMAESRDYDMSVSGKPYQSLLIIGIFWCIVSMKSVQFSVFTGYKCHIARHGKRGMSPSIYITIHIHTFLIFIYYIIHIARCAPWLIW